ncbi:MAG: hypothetical protein ACP6IP_07775 [Candidatus Njordarchaeia archaeon]
MGFFMAYVTYKWGDKFHEFFGNFEWYMKIVLSSIGYAILLVIAFPFSYGSAEALSSFTSLLEAISAVYGVYIGLTVGERFYKKWVDGEGIVSFVTRGLIGFMIVAIPFFATKFFEGLHFIAVLFFLIGFLLTAVVPPIINSLPKGVK